MSQSSEEALWRAVREEVMTYGVSRSTVTSVAKRAGLSRMTVYRRAGGMEQLVLDALAHELGSVGSLVADELAESADPVGELAEGVADVVGALVDSELLDALRRHDPELLLPYLVGHFGRGQVGLAAQLTRSIEQARARCAELGRPLRAQPAPHEQARFLIVALQSFVMVVGDEPELTRELIEREVTHLVAGYLRSGATDD